MAPSRPVAGLLDRRKTRGLPGRGRCWCAVGHWPMVNDFARVLLGVRSPPIAAPGSFVFRGVIGAGYPPVWGPMRQSPTPPEREASVLLRTAPRGIRMGQLD